MKGLPHSFSEAKIIIIPILKSETTKKTRLISLINIDAKILKKILKTDFRSILKELYSKTREIYYWIAVNVTLTESIKNT